MNIKEGTLDDILKRILAREENALIRQEWESIQQDEHALLVAFQRCFTETEIAVAIGAASYVARNLPSFVARRIAVYAHVTRLMQTEPPGPITFELDNGELVRLVPKDPTS